MVSLSVLRKLALLPLFFFIAIFSLPSDPLPFDSLAPVAQTGPISGDMATISSSASFIATARFDSPCVTLIDPDGTILGRLLPGHRQVRGLAFLPGDELLAIAGVGPGFIGGGREGAVPGAAGEGVGVYPGRSAGAAGGGRGGGLAFQTATDTAGTGPGAEAAWVELRRLDGGLLRRIDSGLADLYGFAVDSDGRIYCLGPRAQEPSREKSGAYGSYLKVFSQSGELVIERRFPGLRASGLALSASGTVSIGLDGENADFRQVSRFAFLAPGEDSFSYLDLPNHSEYLLEQVLSPDGSRLYGLSFSLDKEWREVYRLLCWDRESEELTIIEESRLPIHTIACLPGGGIIASQDIEQDRFKGSQKIRERYTVLRRWDAEGRLIAAKRLEPSEVDASTYSPSLGLLLVAKSGIEVFSESFDHISFFAENKRYPEYLAVSDNYDIAVVDKLGSSMSIWNKYGALTTVDEKDTGPSGGVQAISYLSGGEIAEIFDEGIRIRSAGGEIISAFSNKDWHDVPKALSAAGMAALGRTSGEVELIGRNGQLEEVIEISNRPIEKLEFSRNGFYLAAVTADEHCFIIDIDDGSISKPFTNIKARKIAVSPRGDYLLVAGGRGRSPKNRLNVSIHFTDGKVVPLVAPDDRFYPAAEFRSLPITEPEIALSPDGRTIAVSSGPAQIDLWRDDGSHLATLEEVYGEISSLTFGPAGRYLYTGSRGGNISVWNTESSRAVSLLRRGTEWLAYTEEGYFASSIKGTDLLSLVAWEEKGPNQVKQTGFAQVLSAAALSSFLNRPDLVLRRLPGLDRELVHHYFERYLFRLAELNTLPQNIEKEDAVSLLAKLSVHGEELFHKQYYLLGDAYLKRSQTQTDDRLSLLHEEVMTDHIESAFKQNVFAFADTNPYPTGTAPTADDSPAEKVKGKERNAQGEATQKGDLYFLGFGVSRYKDPDLDLLYPAKDAEDLGAFFQSIQGPYEEIYTRIFVDSECNKAAIENSVRFLKNVKEEDSLIVFVSGHGMHGTSAAAHYYFLTYEANPKDLAGTAVRFDVIERLAARAKACHKLLLIDTCESANIKLEDLYSAQLRGRRDGLRPRIIRGELIEDRLSGLSPARLYLNQDDRYIYNDLKSRTGAAILRSSHGGELTYELSEFIPERNGFFTASLLASLNDFKSDLDGNGRLSLEEIARAVDRELLIRSRDRQHPLITGFDPPPESGMPLLADDYEIARDPQFYPYLEVLLEEGNVERAVSLLETASRSGPSIYEKALSTVIRKAASVGNFDLCYQILNRLKYLQTLQKPSLRETGLSTAASEAFLQGHLDILDLLLAGGAGVPPSYLLVLKQQGKEDLLGRYLAEPEKISTIGIDTALADAVELGMDSIARRLVILGADPNSPTSSGGPILSEAISKGALDLAGFLVENGARINWARSAAAGPDTDLFGVSVSAYPASAGPTAAASFPPPLAAAAETGNVGFVRYLLSKRPDMSGQAAAEAVLIAAKEGHGHVLSALLDAGADPDSYCSASGVTALMHAVASKDPALVRLLLDAGAGVNTADYTGTTALILAAGYRSASAYDMAVLLIEAGADPHARNAEGRTPLSEARRRDNQLLAEYIRSLSLNPGRS